MCAHAAQGTHKLSKNAHERSQELAKSGSYWKAAKVRMKRSHSGDRGPADKPAECRGPCPSCEGNIDSKPDSSNHRVMTLGLGQWRHLPPSLSSIPGHIFLEGENQFLQVASSTINAKKESCRTVFLTPAAKKTHF